MSRGSRGEDGSSKTSRKRPSDDASWHRRLGAFDLSLVDCCRPPLSTHHVLLPAPSLSVTNLSHTSSKVVACLLLAVRSPPRDPLLLATTGPPCNHPGVLFSLKYGAARCTNWPGHVHNIRAAAVLCAMSGGNAGMVGKHPGESSPSALSSYLPPRVTNALWRDQRPHPT